MERRKLTTTTSPLQFRPTIETPPTKPMAPALNPTPESPPESTLSSHPPRGCTICSNDGKKMRSRVGYISSGHSTFRVTHTHTRTYTPMFSLISTDTSTDKLNNPQTHYHHWYRFFIKTKTTFKHRTHSKTKTHMRARTHNKIHRFTSNSLSLSIHRPICKRQTRTNYQTQSNTNNPHPFILTL